MKYVQILFLMFFFTSANAKYIKYSCSKKNAYFDGIDLRLNSEFRYAMSANTYTERHGDIITLSTGSYHYEKNKVILSDDNSGYVMVLYKVGKNLKVKKAYSFLLGATFRNKGENNVFKDFSFAPSAPIVIGKTAPPHFISGIFSCQGNDDRFNYWQGIWFEFKGISYRVYLGKELLSEGKFIQEDNKLTLSDKILGNDFTLNIVSKERIVAKNFIGPWTDYYLTNKKQVNRGIQKEGYIIEID